MFRQFRVFTTLLPFVMQATALAACVSAALPEQAPRATTVKSSQATDQLNRKRYVAAGDRAYIIGTTDGRFPPMGWHIRGKMGGVWTHPIKLLDGYWFALNDKWLPPAKRFKTEAGYVQMDFPQTEGFEVSRTEFAPDGLPVVLVGLTIRNPKHQARKFTLILETHSEILAAFPWSDSKPQNAKAFNRKDEVAYDSAAGTLTFREPGKPWYAIVGASVRSASGATGDEFWGPTPKKQQQDFSSDGNGSGGQLRWRMKLSGGATTTVWFAVSGSHVAKNEAQKALRTALAAPDRLLREKVSDRKALLERTKVTLPDQMLQMAFDWGKLNMADLRRTVTYIQVRDVNEGKAYPPPVTGMRSLAGIGAGFPDYPWYFGTDGAYTTYPLIASGQWDTAIAHLRAIRDVSRAVNGDTGKVVHEVVTDGSVILGINADAGNTNETAQFAVAVDQVLRWSGDEVFRDEMYDFVKDGLTYVTSELDQDGDGWPEGLGIFERPGLGSEKLDVTAYTWQALQGLERMAASKGDTSTRDWAKTKANAMQAAFGKAWSMTKEGLYADSLCNEGDEVPPAKQHNGWVNVCTKPDQQLQQRHWINATPMETLLVPAKGAAAALSRLESSTFSGTTGLYHTGKGGGPDGRGDLRVWTLPNSVMAVAEANYGRLGQALKYMNAIAAQLDLEMPGALPEIVPSPEYNPFIDFRERAMFMQAWSSYGIQWPVIHHFLGVQPDMPAGCLSVVPHIPISWPGLSVQRLHVGNGTIEASAARNGKRYMTTVSAPASWKLTLGHTLPRGVAVKSVTLDGVAVPYNVLDTTRGRELRVETATGSSHTLLVTVK